MAGKVRREPCANLWYFSINQINSFPSECGHVWLMIGSFYFRVGTITALWTVGHRFKSIPTNGPITAPGLPRCSSIQVLTVLSKLLISCVCFIGHAEHSSADVDSRAIGALRNETRDSGWPRNYTHRRRRDMNHYGQHRVASILPD